MVETRAHDLQTESVGMSGFLVQNLWYTRRFYLEYSASELLQPLVGDISWAKHLLILSKCKDPPVRAAILHRADPAAQRTRAVLLQQLKEQTYQTVRKPHEQPSIGIIICQSKQRPVAKVALRNVDKPIGMAMYTYTDTLPQELRPFFPSNAELAQRLEAVTAALQKGARLPSKPTE